MDGEIGVVEIVLAREIPFELEITVIGLEFLKALLELGDERLVVLFLEKFMTGQEVVVLLLEVLDERQGVLEPGKPARDLLGRLGLVPEVGLGRLFFESFYFPLGLSGVKDDPSLR